MTDLNLPIDYATRLLGYDLFTSKIKVLSDKLAMEFSHPVELAVLYDMIGRNYLNVLDTHIYTVNTLPIFYLQLEDVNPYLNLIADNNFICRTLILSDYVKHRFADKVKVVKEYLDYLNVFILHYYQEYFKHDIEILITFIKSSLLKNNVTLSTSIDKITGNSIVSKMKLFLSNTPEPGDNINILRPYFIKANKTWEVKKISAFGEERPKRVETCHFDIFSTTVIDKKIVDDDMLVITLETDDKAWQFVAHINLIDYKKRLIIQWYMTVGNGKPTLREMEPIPFYQLKDIVGVNGIKGRKLSKFQLKCLITDVEIQLASM